ncbi:elafin [Eschrichtius robustus]|uniref:elafin n=1 Tax=Eschrichtius robustus TaxID=9764 RepID=UPI0035C1DDF1
MKSRNFLSPVVVLLVLGTLVAQAAVIKGQGNAKGQDPVKGQHPFKGQDPVKGQDQVKVTLPYKPGLCPIIQMQCTMINPANKCLRDADCPGRMKCCVGFCGRDCVNPW